MELQPALEKQQPEAGSAKLLRLLFIVVDVCLSVYAFGIIKALYWTSRPTEIPVWICVAAYFAVNKPPPCTSSISTSHEVIRVNPKIIVKSINFLHPLAHFQSHFHSSMALCSAEMSVSETKYRTSA